MYSIPILITESELDPEYNHVHHSTVLCFLEKARIAFMESAGLSQNKLFDLDLWAVIVEIHVEYLREVKKGEYLVTCDGIAVERRRITFDQRILDSNNREVVQAKVRIMWFSKKAGKAVTPPEDVIETLNSQKKVFDI